MNKAIIVYFLFCLLMQNIVFTQTPTYVPIDPHWTLKWEDEFKIFDATRWNKAHQKIHTADTKEPQLYLGNQVWTLNGNLVIEINNDTVYCPNPAPPNDWICVPCIAGKKYNYRSGWIETKYPYFPHFGFIEARIKLPYVKNWGFWPAFWTMVGYYEPNTHNPAEIDIFEVSGARHPVTTFTTNVHTCYEKPEFPGCVFSKYHGEHTFSNYKYSDWHTYAIEWNKDRIIWYMDGKAFRTTNNHDVIDPVRLLFNVGIDKKHLPPTSPPWTDYMYVDYVRVYSLKCEENPDKKVVNEIANFNTYNYAVKKSITMSNATTIPANSNITLRATDFIELKPGFSIDTGRELYLDVTSCPGTPILKPPPQRE